MKYAWSSQIQGLFFLFLGPRESREKWRPRSSPGLAHTLEVHVLCSGPRTGSGTGLHPLESDRDGEGTWRHVTGEMTKGTENVYPGEEKPHMGEGDSHFGNTERLSCEKGIRCVFHSSPKELQTMRRSREAKRKNFLFLKSNFR